MSREYYQLNKEKFRKQNKENYLNNIEERREGNKKYYLKNKENIKKYRVQYYKDNWYYLNKYQKFGLGIPEARTMPKECEKRKEGRLYVLHWHHRDFNRNNNTKKNLQVLCANCHMEIHFINSLNNKDKIYGKK